MNDENRDVHRFHGRMHFSLDEEKVIDFLEIRKGMKVLDVGGADGYYAKKIAARGADVTIIDAHDYNFKELNGIGIRTIQQDFCRDLDETFDMVFMAHVYHDLVLSCKEKTLRNLKRVSTNYITNLDFVKEELRFGPPSSVKLNKAEVVRDMREIGFVLKKETDLPYHYLQLFSKV
jgi:SAM-dependent methyltransferase